MVESWNKAEGVYIPKIEDAKEIGDYRPISLLEVDGKIMFGILAKRLTEYLLANGFVNTSVQKAGVPGFQGCIEHSYMIWETLQEAKKQKKDLSVIWLDLANAYGSVPHKIIEYALHFFHVPQQFIDYIMKYYRGFKMRFTTNKYTTQWQELEVGIPIGCSISPVLFVLAMELLVRGAERYGKGVEFAPNQELPSIRAFMDDLTILTPSFENADAILKRLEELMAWSRMKFKAKKSRCLVMKSGKVEPERHFSLAGEGIPTVSSSPVKSLGRLYTEELTDVGRVKEIKDKLKDGLGRINKTMLPGKMKLWCLRFGLMPRIMWPLSMYEVAISHVEEMERTINGFIRRWLGVPRCLSDTALYCSDSKLNLPLSSIVEEFMVTKVRCFISLRDSPDPVVRNILPNVKSGRKWEAQKAVADAESRLRHLDIVGSSQTDRRGLGWNQRKSFGRAMRHEKKDMVVNVVKGQLEDERFVKAVGQAQQGRWTQWESLESRTISWNELLSFEPLLLSFLLKSSYDVLPTPSNLHKWKLQDNERCPWCNERGTLQHILSSCKVALQKGMYTWRHNNVLREIKRVLQQQVASTNKDKTERLATMVNFVKEGEKVVPTARKKDYSHGLLHSSNDWNVLVDVDGMLRFPECILVTDLRPDIVLFSPKSKTVVISELTVPWEENIDVAHEFKFDKYSGLSQECREKGWLTVCMPVEVSCRGFIAHSFSRFLSELGVKCRVKKCLSTSVSRIATRSSAWVWQKARLNAKLLSN